MASSYITITPKYTSVVFNLIVYAHSLDGPEHMSGVGSVTTVRMTILAKITILSLSNRYCPLMSLSYKNCDE